MRAQWLFAACALTGWPVLTQAPAMQELPVGHPPLDGGMRRAPALPPAAPGSEMRDLPAGHPPIDAAAPQKPPAQLPSGHPAIKPGTEASNADDLLKKLEATPDLKNRVNSFEVGSSIGRLYYSRARYADAADFFAIALAKAEPARQLFFQERKKAVAQGTSSEGCPKEANNSLEHQTSVAQAAAKAGHHALAFACVQEALQAVLEIGDLNGNALFLTGKPAAAAEQFERVVQVSDSRAETLFAHGTVLLDSKGDDLSSLRRAKADFEKYLRLSPNGQNAAEAQLLLTRVEQALSAGGITKLAQKRAEERKTKTPVATQTPPPPTPSAPFASSGGSAGGASGASAGLLTQEMVDAVKNTERTPELEQGLAKLVQEGEDHLAHARYQEALDAYKRVVPFQPDDGRARAGMAWALLGLNRQPMAERVWSMAVQGDPAAVERLGDTLSSKGDKRGANALWAKLASSAPDYARKVSLNDKIK